MKQLVELHTMLHNPLHVATISQLLYKLVERHTRIELARPNSEHLAAILASLLGFCNENDDFESAEKILHGGFCIFVDAEADDSSSMTDVMKLHPFWFDLRFWGW